MRAPLETAEPYLLCRCLKPGHLMNAKGRTRYGRARTLVRRSGSGTACRGLPALPRRLRNKAIINGFDQRRAFQKGRDSAPCCPETPRFFSLFPNFAPEFSEKESEPWMPRLKMRSLVGCAG
jgi:hypothetical protein